MRFLIVLSFLMTSVYLFFAFLSMIPDVFNKDFI